MPTFGSRKAIVPRDLGWLLMVENSFRLVSKYQTGQIIILALAFTFSTAACITLSYVNFVLAPDCLLFAKWSHSEKNILPKHRHQNEIRILLTDNSTSVVDSDSNITTTSDYDDDSDNNLIIDDIVTQSPEISVEKESWTYGEFSMEKPLLELDSRQTRWGSKRHCYVTQYGFAAAAVTSFILCWFFVFFRPTRTAYLFKKKTAASKLIVPAIILSVAFVLCVIIASTTLQLGVGEWCDGVTVMLRKCNLIRYYALSWAGKTTYVNFWYPLVGSQIMAWCATIFWIANLFLLSQRLYRHVDFPDYFFCTPDDKNGHKPPNCIAKLETDIDLS